MLSLKLVREHPEIVREALRKRHTKAPLDEILQLDEERRKQLAEIEELRARRNQVSQQIGRMKEKPPDLIASMREVGNRISALQERLASTENQLNDLSLYLPNIPNESVPAGEDERDNVELRRSGTPPSFGFAPKPHWEIGESLGIFDFQRAAKISGARSWVLCGDGARLNRALIQFMLDLQTQRHGYTEVATPYLVKPEAMVGTGQFPKFINDAYTVDTGELVLIPTAEVPVTNLHREEILPGDALPIHYVCYSACFRREAGAAGRDTRGLTRVHQFDKIELVRFERPSESYEALESLTKQAARVLEELGLAYRVVLLCTGDLGFAAAKTYDLEVWFASQGAYREISSCSNFEEFQARRASIRYRPTPQSSPEFVHTLNGSGLAVGRTMAALVESYQQEDGTVVVPEALRPYLGGQAVIRRQVRIRD